MGDLIWVGNTLIPRETFWLGVAFVLFLVIAIPMGLVSIAKFMVRRHAKRILEMNSTHQQEPPTPGAVGRNRA